MLRWTKAMAHCLSHISHTTTSADCCWLPISRDIQWKEVWWQVCAWAKEPVKQPSQDPFCIHKEMNKWHGFGFIGRGLQPGGKLQRGLGGTVATPLPSVVTVCSYLHANPSLPTPSWKPPRGSATAAALSGWGIKGAGEHKGRRLMGCEMQIELALQM